MNQDFVYLKSNVVPEPLFDQWYASSFLIPPATASMFILERHLKIMESYISAPQIHEEAVKNPRMLGGPFMDFKGNRVEAVKKLRSETIEKQSDLIEFAKAIQKLNSLLSAQAKGMAIEPLYQLVPDLLRGYIEIFYDLNNNPSFRFFEPLLYRSKYYKEGNQSLSMYLIEDDDRPFVLSTPRLEEESRLHVQIPFRSPAIDDLFRMQRNGGSYSEIREKFGISPGNEATFKTFFTPVAPRPYSSYTGDGIRTRYFGHACILVESPNVSILSDPVISYGYNTKLSRFSYDDLPDVIDYVLITHNHQDHILIETLLQLRHKVRTFVIPRTGNGHLQDQNLKMILKAVGIENIVELDELDTLSYKDVTITGLPFLGEHCDLDIRTKICYHVKVDDFSLIFAADSNNIEPRVYEFAHDIVGDIDVLFLGMECDGAPLSWLYGPLLPLPPKRDQDNSRRLAGCNYAKAIDLVNRFNPKQVFVYAMGQEPWLTYIMSLKYTDESNPIVQSNMLIKECQSRGLVAERLFGEKELVYAH